MAEGLSGPTALTVRDELSPKLQKIMEQVAALADALNQLNAVKLFGNIAADSRGALVALKKVADTANGLGTNLGSFGSSAGSLGGLVNAAGAIADSFAHAARDAGHLNSSLSAIAGQTESLGPVVAELKQLSKTEETATGKEDETRKKPSWSETAETLQKAGAVLSSVGERSESGLKAVFAAGARYEAAFAGFKALHLGDAINADADKFASSAQFFGISAAQMMDTLSVLQQRTNDFEKTKKFAPLMAQMAFANQTVYSDGRKFDEAEGKALTNVIAMRGGFEKDGEAESLADLVEHVISASHAQVMPSEFLDFIQQSGAVAKLMTDRELMANVAPLFPQFNDNGGEVGSDIAGAYQSLTLGRTTPQAAKELEYLGLLGKSGLETDDQGRFLGIQAGAVEGSGAIPHDPMKFLMDTLLPAFQKKNITSDEAIINEIGKVFSDPRAAALFTTLYQRRTDIAAKSSIYAKGGMDVGQVEALAQKTPEGAMRALTTAWEDFLKALSPAVMIAVANGLKFLTFALNGLTDFARKHGTLVGILMGLVIGFTIFSVSAGAILTALGSLILSILAIGALFALLSAMIGTGAAAWLIGIAAAIAGVVTAILFIPWDQIGEWFKDGIWNAVIKGLRYLFEQISQWWSGLSDQAKVFVVALAVLFFPLTLVTATLAYVVAYWGEILNWATEKWRESGETVNWLGQLIQDTFDNLLSSFAKMIASRLGIPPEVINAALGVVDKVSGTPDSIGGKAAAALAGGLPGPGDAAIRTDTAHFFSIANSPTIQGSPAPAAAAAAAGQAVGRAAEVGEAANPAAAAPVQIQPGQGVINLDGHSVGTWLMQFIDRQSGGPNTGPSAHDPQQSFTPTGVPILGAGYG